ncbi:MAG: polysaccharide deacetylase family protein [Acidobacteria bacterium]|nr:polysaccharide deacetylase family protein [Acidobacteriota bacterium]
MDRAIEEYNHPYGFEGYRTSRGALRHAALSLTAAYWQGVGKVDYWLRKERIQFLYMHHLFPPDEAGFRHLLESLRATHQFLGYSEAVQRLEQDRIDRPYVCLSFDDGLRQNINAAMILQEYDIPACFFVCPGLVGERDSVKLKEICATRFRMPPTELLSWAEVEALVAAGFEIGSHTMTHQVLAQLSSTQLTDEIGQSYEVLKKRLGEVQHFAWPEGRYFHFSDAAARAVYEAGYQSCASAERGCHTTQLLHLDETPILRRDYLPAHWPYEHVLYFLTRNSQRAAGH